MIVFIAAFFLLGSLLCLLVLADHQAGAAVETDRVCMFDQRSFFPAGAEPAGATSVEWSRQHLQA